MKSKSFLSHCNIFLLLAPSSFYKPLSFLPLQTRKQNLRESNYYHPNLDVVIRVMIFILKMRVRGRQQSGKQKGKEDSEEEDKCSWLKKVIKSIFANLRCNEK